MNAPSSRHRFIAALLALLAAGSTAHAADRPILRKLTVDPDARRIGLFEAREEGLITILVVPRNEREATVSLTNASDAPLTVEIPKAVAAVHVLRQFQQPPFGPNAQNSNDPNNQQGAAQSVSGQMFGFQQQGPNNNGQNFFSIPAEKTVQLKLRSVCLDHGKPTPTTRMKYDLRPIETVARNPALVHLIETADFHRGDRDVIQAAAWNLSNGLPFEKLATLTTGIGVIQPQFAAPQLQQARKLVDAARRSAEEQQKSRATASR